jgi:hypothetical protein
VSEIQCKNLSDDREIGAAWERNFCRIMARYGYVFTPFQIGRNKSAQCYFMDSDNKYQLKTLPDIFVMNSPGEYHEIKHKEPTKHGSFGLEKYRLNALLWFSQITNQKVFYTIHNHKLAGGKHVKVNSLSHWVFADVNDLKDKYREFNGFSWVNGEQKKVSICYFDQKLFKPLESHIKKKENYSFLNKEDSELNISEGFVND